MQGGIVQFGGGGTNNPLTSYILLMTDLQSAVMV